jgi:hypothetical protein
MFLIGFHGLYILYFFILLIIIFFIYIRLKYRFWFIQPVFHFYDFHYWIRNVGIISNELPQKNKFTNFYNIKTFSTISENQWKNITAFIQLNYLKNKNNIFYPKLKNIQNYFVGHNHPFYWSFYQIKELIQDEKNNNIIEQNKIIGVMSSRPLTCIINDINFDLYYVDYLCVDKYHRNKNIAPQIIQTHEYNQSHSNKKISVSLFKREEELTGIIPLTCYDTYCYNISDFINISSLLNLNINLLTCDKQNIYYFYHFIKEYSYKWNIYIFPSISNLYNLIESENIFIKMLVIDKEIIAAYIFKKTCTHLDKNKELLACIGSINGNQLNNNEFIDGFKISISSLLSKNKNIFFLSIENISDNEILNNYTNYSFKSPTAYFFYNFAHSPFKSNKCLIIN